MSLLYTTAAGTYTSHGAITTPTAMTVAMWVYVLNNKSWNYCVAQRDGSVGWELNINASGYIGIRMERTTLALVSRMGTPGLSENTWYFFAVSIDQSGADGDQKSFLGTETTPPVEVSTYAVQQVGSGTYSDGAGIVHVGTPHASDDSFGRLDGRISCVSIFDGALDAGELRKQWRAQHHRPSTILMAQHGYYGVTAPDFSGNGRNGVVTGGAQAPGPSVCSPTRHLLPPTYMDPAALAPIEPAAASAIASTVAPTVVLGDLVLTPAVSGAIASTVAPTVVLGDLILTPAPAGAIASTVDPDVSAGALVITPAPASAVASTGGPLVDQPTDDLLHRWMFLESGTTPPRKDDWDWTHDLEARNAPNSRSTGPTYYPKMTSFGGGPTGGWLRDLEAVVYDIGDTDWSLEFWWDFDLATADEPLQALWNATDKQFRFYREGTELKLAVKSNTDASTTTLTFSVIPIIDSLYHITIWHDSVNDEIGIAVNAIHVATLAWTKGIDNTGTPYFRVGDDDDLTNRADGAVGVMGWYNKVLTSQERFSAYNNGKGWQPLNLRPLYSEAVASTVDPVVLIGGVTITPTPASAVANTVGPTVVLGDLTIIPSSASSVAKSVAPIVVLGSLAVTPTPSSAVAGVVNPTVVLGTLVLTPTPAGAIASTVDPIVSGGGLTLTPTPVSGIASTVNPGVVLGSLTLTPSPSAAVASTVDPTVQNGLAISPAPAGAIASTVAPIVVLGTLVLTPPVASAIASTVDPDVILGSIALTPAPASAIAETVDPTVINGLVVTPAPAGAIASTVNPDVILGSITYAPGFSWAVAGRVDPDVVLGSLSISPTPASARAQALIITYKVYWPRHVRGAQIGLRNG